MEKDFERLRLVTPGVRGRACCGQELGGEGQGGGPGGRGGHWVGEDDPGGEDGDALGRVVVNNRVVIVVVNDVDIVVVVVIKIVVVV